VQSVTKEHAAKGSREREREREGRGSRGQGEKSDQLLALHTVLQEFSLLAWTSVIILS